MRSFIAITPPDPVLDALVLLQADLAFGRPLPEENLHLTLAFLGDASEEILGEVDMGLSSLRSPTVDISFEGLDWLSADHPGLVAAMVRPTDALTALHRSVEQVARSAGARLPRRRFRPHVTLSRGKSGPGRAGLGAAFAPDATTSIPAFKAYEIGLFASQIGPKGVRYDLLESYPLLG